MCGITGYWDSHRTATPQVAEQMALKIQSRGPDDYGVWCDDNYGLAIAHRRLSVIDLSPAGHQPMHSADDRYVLVYNGEIYNFESLREELEHSIGTISWRGHSDTEVLLACIQSWGLENTLQKLNGMFAFALWDKKSKCLTLARDRLGEKPLYYGVNNGAFLFGSELKSLSSHPAWQAVINRDAITKLLRYMYIPTPHSIYEGIQKLPAASYITISDAGKSISDPVYYWSLQKTVNFGINNQLSDREECLEQVEALLRESVEMRMVSDVPLGVFLSGGYDSSLITALMKNKSSSPTKTFSIGFHESDYNEAEHAKKVSQHLGTDHTELYVTSQDALNVIPDLPKFWDEPFADPSQIPTYLVSKLARKHVTVALAGDGGDELFAGYQRHIDSPAIWNKINSLPILLRKPLGKIFQNLLQIRWLKPGTTLKIENFQRRLDTLAHAIVAQDTLEFYNITQSHSKIPHELVIGSNSNSKFDCITSELNNQVGNVEQMMFFDTKQYLPDDILVKTDRASMAVSLEARVPFHDHRLVELAWKIPSEFNLRNSKGKSILRDITHKHIPAELMDRPKQGFGVPIEHWLSGPLRDWSEDLLDPVKMKQQGFFQTEHVEKIWELEKKSPGRWHLLLWDILMFQAWLQEYHH